MLIQFSSRALCHLQTLKRQEAVKDFKRVLELDPKNALAKSQLDETRKLIRKAEFEKAIAMEEKQNAAERCKEIIQEGLSIVYIRVLFNLDFSRWM